MENLTIALTFKNRAHFLDNFLHYYSNFVEYDMKKVEICITDGNSTDNLFEVIEKWYKKFNQIKYALSDRSKLPFTLPTNNPACDINTQICNVVTYDTILRTDAEVLPPTNILKVCEEKFNEGYDLIWYQNVCFGPDSKYSFKSNRTDNYTGGGVSGGGLCNCFKKNTYIEQGGIEEKFSQGFAWEDTNMLEYWKRTKKVYYAPYHPITNVVYHFWHGYEKNMDFNMKLWHSYSYPLHQHMLKNMIKPNTGNPNWKRPEMISNIKIWKDGE